MKQAVFILIYWCLCLALGAQGDAPGGTPSIRIQEGLPTAPPEKKEEEAFVLPPLPVWDPEDIELLKEGELLPGESLLSETFGDLVLPPPPPVPVPPPEIITPGVEPAPREEYPEIIGEEFVDEYFGQRPISFLLDPQELLSRQELRDRESFLHYHASDSEIELYFYLFDARQELPEGVTIERIMEQHYQQSGPTALIFYFLGMPERAQLALSPEITSVVSLDEHQRALRNAIQEAFEKSDPAYQLDNFAVELSIRLYWFEKAMAAMDSSPEMATTSDEEVVVPDPKKAEVKQTVMKWLKPTVITLGLVVLSALLGFLGKWIAERRLRYVFPEVEPSPLLGAPHAAGVGAVISFTSAQLPAAQQRDQVPDYLQKM